MAKTHDIFLRAYTLAAGRKGDKKKPYKPQDVPNWPQSVLVFDTEARNDTRQDLTFGAYRLCQLTEGKYLCSKEGLFYADDINARERAILQNHIADNNAEIEIKTFPPKLDLALFSRSAFIEKVLWKAIRDGAIIVGFNLPFDLSRIAAHWRTGRKDSWSLILSLRRSRKTGEIEPNPERPRINIRSKDSHSAFISITQPQHSDEWPRISRFLDLHTLAFALFAESFGLDALCEKLRVPGKDDHEPTGQITSAEIAYCRGDVRATVAALNGLKVEFDRHPLDKLRPERAYSPASMAKAYMDAMGIVPPRNKFKVPKRVHGIAMQTYFGGRAECKIRRHPVPVIPTDFKSQYPTVNTLLGNWNILTANSVSFEDSTEEVRALLSNLTSEDLFKPKTWTKLSFFALIHPQKDVFPIRTVYNSVTQNIGINELSSSQPIWFAGPDVVASRLLSGKVAKILKAIRIVPHGKQAGLKPTNLRGMIEIKPERHDFFRRVVEQRELHKDDKNLAGFLKILVNSGSYGLFVEINPDNRARPVEIEVFSGEKTVKQPSDIIEEQGKWFFSPMAALIIAGGRLLLAMLERCVTDAGGAYLFCDTDSLCIVGSTNGGLFPCPGGRHKLPDGTEAVRALSLKEVKDIADKFNLLNLYDQKAVKELLKIEKVFDNDGKFRELMGYAISAKRYVLYRQFGEELEVVDPKAHGLGYLYPPIDAKDRNKADPTWTAQAWEWLLRKELNLPRNTPKWIEIPAMMRVVVSTPNVLQRIRNFTRPFNFILIPMIDAVAGHPAGVDPQRFTPITAFNKKRDSWINANCTNVYDSKEYRLSLEQTPGLDKIIPQTFGYILNLYPRHPESKSLGPNDEACGAETRGLLKRASIIAEQLRYVGKETDRRWTEGEDITLLTFRPVEYAPQGKVRADEELREQISERGMRELIRLTGLSQHTIEAIREGKQVRQRTLKRVREAVQH